MLAHLPISPRRAKKIDEDLMAHVKFDVYKAATQIEITSTVFTSILLFHVSLWSDTILFLLLPDIKTLPLL